MMFPYSPFSFPRYNYHNYYKQSFNSNYKNKQNTTSTMQSKNLNIAKEEKKSSSNTIEENYFIDLFGLKLQYDDILLVCLIFFLYKEGIKDTSLFLILILLLIN